MSWTRGVSVGLLVAALVGCAPAGGGRPAGEGSAAPEPAASASAPTGPPEHVTLALPSVAGVFIPHVLAQQKGFFREEGLDVELPVMRSNLVTAGLASGEADYSGQFGPTVRDVLAGMPFRLVGAVVDKSTRWIMVTPEIRSVEQ